MKCVIIYIVKKLSVAITFQFKRTIYASKTMFEGEVIHSRILHRVMSPTPSAAHSRQTSARA